MAKKIDLTGNIIGKLTVHHQAISETKTNYWHCTCECGKNIKYSTRKLNSGTIKSCGSCGNKKRKDKSKFTK